MRKLGKYIISEKDAASLHKHLSEVYARTQELNFERRDIEQAKANMASEQLVSLPVFRMQEVLSSVPRLYVVHHEQGIP
jgi:hypothetical protein